MNKKKACLYLFPVLIALGVFYLFAPLSMPASTEEVDQINGVTKYLKENFEFGTQPKPIFVRYGAAQFPWKYLLPHKITIYGELESSKQDAIINLVQTYKQRHDISPVKIIFKEKKDHSDSVIKRKTVW
jgi:hypothetical protein